MPFSTESRRLSIWDELLPDAGVNLRRVDRDQVGMAPYSLCAMVDSALCPLYRLGFSELGTLGDDRPIELSQ